jgi:hypothetical protein
MAEQDDKPIRAEAIRRRITARISKPEGDPSQDLLAQIDAWRMSQPEPQPDRQAAWKRSGAGRLPGVGLA